MSAPLLRIEDLHVRFQIGERAIEAVRGVDLDIERGQTVALVGESGSGKSVTAHSILRLLPYPPASHPRGRILYRDQDLLKVSEADIRKVRGNGISMIFQEPMSSLNPLHTVERQVTEILSVHRGLRANAARARAIELLDEVGLPDPASRLADFPHQLSGGQRQRVMIAMALANEPDLLIADEPTTALDVTVQAQILALLKRLQARHGMAMLFISHDLSVVRRIADDVHVMTEGQIVEHQKTAELFANPRHPYTIKLLNAEPKGEPPVPAPGAATLMSAENLKVWFPIKRGLLKRTVGHIKAVNDVSLSLRAGETLAVVGESGSGKTTLGRALLRLVESQGRIVFSGQSIDGLGWRNMRPLRKHMQIVFQDPYGSLSPRMSVGEIIEEGMAVHLPQLTQAERTARLVAALQEVGLDPDSRFRYPHEFSGGQRQRIAIARAIVLEPQLLVLDEPTSALDVSVQAQVVEVLRSLQRLRGLTYLFISHDLRVVKALATRVIVMRDGVVVESGDAEDVFTHPREAYTRDLIAAAFDTSLVETGPTQ